MTRKGLQVSGNRLPLLFPFPSLVVRCPDGPARTIQAGRWGVSPSFFFLFFARSRISRPHPIKGLRTNGGGRRLGHFFTRFSIRMLVYCLLPPLPDLSVFSCAPRLSPLFCRPFPFAAIRPQAWCSSFPSSFFPFISNIPFYTVRFSPLGAPHFFGMVMSVCPALTG